MKRVLGLDLGIGSIGWALIDIAESDNENNQIINLGSRIVPLDTDETTGFTKGKGETLCSQRTSKRSIRRMNARFKQRRSKICLILDIIGFPSEISITKLSPLEIWRLRAEATERELSPEEISRVIFHINQRRGYKDSKADGADASRSDYLLELRGRASEAERENLTPGQYFYNNLLKSVYITPKGKACSYKVKEKVFPRQSYEKELQKILKKQQEFYPEILNDKNISLLFDAVFFQRPLKSCKHLVSICEFEKRAFTDKQGNIIETGPKVAPISSPIVQLERIWEAINNITLKNYKNKRKKKTNPQSVIPGLLEESRIDCFEYIINNKERFEIFNYLDSHESMTGSQLLKILGLKKEDGFSPDKMAAKGIKGNYTKFKLEEALKNIPNKKDLLRFDIKLEDTNFVNKTTGEIFQKVSSDYLREPLYQLWHTIYTIDDFNILKKVLYEKFGIDDEETVEKLFRIDFRGKGYASKSAKFICKIIPLLMQGNKYSESCALLGINHSESMTKKFNEQRVLNNKLSLLKKNELRQPVIEKILNNMVHQINAIIDEYGPIDEIHVEMARALKQNKEEREKESSRINALERENKSISEKISEEIGLRPTRNRIQKVRMYNESQGQCIYCGKIIGIKEFLSGIDAEKEHIIPRSLYFNDSFSNKVCACRECNANKGQQTGYDFMKSKSEEDFNAYVDRIENLFSKYKSSKGRDGISKTKHDLLLTSRSEIPENFIERDLRQTQYISKRAISMLQDICREVLPTSGSVTSFLRHIWGYDEILHNLNLPIYSTANQTEFVKFDENGKSVIRERINNWNKRLDHRHHAIDALVIALTTRSQIKRLNTLNALKPDNATGEKVQNLDKWTKEQFHFSHHTVKDYISNTIISIKEGKKVVTPGKRSVFRKGKRIIIQKNIIVPRGPLSEETIYGKIKNIVKDQPVKTLFANIDNIIDPSVKNTVKKRLEEVDFDIKKALESIKKQPLINDLTGEVIENADCFNMEIVGRKPIESLTVRNKDKIVDARIRELVNNRFEEVGNNDKKFQQSLNDSPIFLDSAKNIPIKKIRIYTGLKETSVFPIKKDESGKNIGFVKYGSNHHVAIYENENGNLVESVVPFMEAVKRRLNNIPEIITSPSELWKEITNREIDQDILSQIPAYNLKFKFSMQINDMFIIGLSNDEICDAIKYNDYASLSTHIYRVQRLSSWYYDFKRHTSTISDTDNTQLQNGNYISIRSEGKFRSLNPRKIKVDRIGRITLI